MKKSILVLIIFTSSVITSAVLAQAPSASSDQKFHFGLKAAPALAWFKTDSPGLSSDGSTFGFSYGLITEFNLTKNYAFGTGLDITYRGGKFKSSFTDPTGSITVNSSTTINLEYIEIPLTLKLKTNEIGYFTYFLQFGLAPGINIGARENAQTTTQIGSASPFSKDTTNMDIKDSINSFNLSMIITGGLEYALSGNTVLLAGITFNNGFLDVISDDKYKANSNYLALTVGVLF